MVAEMSAVPVRRLGDAIAAAGVAKGKGYEQYACEGSRGHGLPRGGSLHPTSYKGRGSPHVEIGVRRGRQHALSLSTSWVQNVSRIVASTTALRLTPATLYVTVISAVPAENGVTIPLPRTLAIVESLLEKVTLPEYMRTPR